MYVAGIQLVDFRNDILEKKTMKIGCQQNVEYKGKLLIP